jgi:hypothetical protein
VLYDKNSRLMMFVKATIILALTGFWKQNMTTLS